MLKYHEQINNLIEKLEDKIKDDDSTGTKVTRVLRTGSWKKRTILRPTGDNPIDIDLVFFIEGDESLSDDIGKLHDFIVDYLEDIYPNKDILRDVDAEGKAKSIKIKFSGTGLEVDIVPVVPLNKPPKYVWQPERGGGGRYTTSVDLQLEVAKDRKDNNGSLTSIVRALKWWRNYKELDETLSSFAIELICSHLDLIKGIETNIEEGIIRFLTFVSSGEMKEITFNGAINSVPSYTTAVYVADPTNNENNVTKKMTENDWDEIMKEANDAFETLSIAQSIDAEGATTEEWKRVFGPSFNIKEE